MKRISDSEIQEIKKLAAKGYSIKQIADLLGRSFFSVKGVVRRYHIPVLNGNYSDELRRKVWKLKHKGKSNAEIERILGLTSRTVRIIVEEEEVWERILHGVDYQPDDPRSKVCQQITVCYHSRCYLRYRCPAYKGKRGV